MTTTTSSAHPVYQEIIDRLLDRLDYIRIQPETILLVGSPMNDVAEKLKQRYPESVIFTENAADNTIDLIIANTPLLEEKIIYDFWRVLRDEGLLLFASLGPDTFFELRDCFAKVDSYAHTAAFIDMHHMGDWMRRMHFSDPVVDRSEITLAYDELDLFFEDLKNAAVKNNHPLRRRSLMTKNQWQKMMSHYVEHKVEDYFPVTLEVIYGHGWKVKLPENDDENAGEVYISVDSILRK